MNFNIHNLVKFKVEGTNKGYLRYLSQDYSHFKTDEPIDSDLDIMVSDFTPDNRNCYVVNHKYWIKKNYLFCADRHKIVRWKVCLTNLTERKTTVYFSGSRFGEVFLRDYIIEPLIGFKLASKGFSILHASAVAINDAGFIFAGGPEVGKTASILSLSFHNNVFLSDEIAILSNDGVVYSFPSPIRIYYYNLKGMALPYQEMTPQQKLEVKIKQFVYVLSLGYAKLPLHISAEKLFQRIGGTYPLRCLILLTKTRDDNIDVTEITNKKALAERLVLINEQQFPYWFKYVSAYSSVYPSGQVASYSQVMVDNLSEALDRVACYEIKVPHKFIESHRDKFRQVIQSLGGGHLED